MKSLVLTIAISCLFFLASCTNIFKAPPVVEKAPDTLSQSTVTIVPKDTRTEIPKGTWVKTDPSEKTTVTLEEDTVATVKKDEVQAKTDGSTVEKQEVIIPKNTEVILPENTYLKTSDSTTVFLEGGSEVTLPPGTEISITKVNWYAVLFYAGLVGMVGWYYLQGKWQKEEEPIQPADKKIEEKKSEETKQQP